MPLDFGQPLRLDGSGSPLDDGSGVLQERDCQYSGGRLVSGARRGVGGAFPAGGRSSQLFHLLRGRHAPARGSIGHGQLEHIKNTRVESVRRSAGAKNHPVDGVSGVGTKAAPFVLSPNRPHFGVPRTMAPRANWKGFLRLSLVTCPVALYPATSESEKISFNQLNRKTGHRIKYSKVDADTGEEVANEDIVKGYKVDTDTFVEVTKEELENVALESTRTIEIDEFVDRTEIDPRYLIRPYYLRPDGKVGHDAFAVIRETIREMDKVAIGRVVLTNREHIIALEAMDKGLIGTLLRYPYEVRDPAEYFDDIQDVKVTKDMLDLARHIVEQKAGRFEPGKFEDQYETALVDLINQKRAGKPITPKERPQRRERGRPDGGAAQERRRRVGGRRPQPPKKPAKKPRRRRPARRRC